MTGTGTTDLTPRVMLALRRVVPFSGKSMYSPVTLLKAWRVTVPNRIASLPVNPTGMPSARPFGWLEYSTND